MWQRIQTLYLLLSGVTATLLLLLSMLTIVSGIDGNAYAANFSGIVTPEWSAMIHFNLVSFVLTVLVILLSFVTIFLFKKRRLQIRLTTIALLLTVAALAYFGYDTWVQLREMQAESRITVWLFLPLVTLLCQYLAIRNIIKDDVLVRASNRLR